MVRGIGRDTVALFAVAATAFWLFTDNLGSALLGLASFTLLFLGSALLFRHLARSSSARSSSARRGIGKDTVALFAVAALAFWLFVDDLGLAIFGFALFTLTFFASSFLFRLMSRSTQARR